MPLPGKIANAPDLEFGLEFYFFAFKDLNTCRSSGFALGNIPWTAINDYAFSNRLSGVARDDFFFIMDAVDAEYIEWQNSKLSKD